MEEDILTLDTIKGTGYNSWLVFFEKCQGLTSSLNKTQIDYMDRHERSQILELNGFIKWEDIAHLAYYEALDKIKEFGFENFKGLDVKVKSEGHGDLDYYRISFITDNKDGSKAYKFFTISVASVEKFAIMEGGQLVKYVNRKSTLDGGTGVGNG